MSVFLKAWNHEDLPPTVRAFLKFFWIAVRGALYTALAGVVIYISNFHPSSATVPIVVGLAMFVEALLVSIGKWVSANGEPRLGEMIQQAAPQVAQDLLNAGRRNDPHVPIEVPPLPPTMEPVTWIRPAMPYVQIGDPPPTYPYITYTGNTTTGWGTYSPGSMVVNSTDSR